MPVTDFSSCHYLFVKNISKVRECGGPIRVACKKPGKLMVFKNVENSVDFVYLYYSCPHYNE